MKFIKVISILISILPAFSCSSSSKDNIKTELCPQRIISMSLASDEVILDIINDERIIGVTYLAGNKNLSNVYSRSESVPNKVRPNLEQITGLNPDMVVAADYIDFSFLNQVKKSGINTLLLKDFNSLSRIRHNITEIGNAVCEKEKTDKLISDIDLKITEIKSRKIEKNPTVLYLFPSIYTSGDETTIGEIIELAGGINIGKEAGITGNKKISTEYILERDPDIIIVGSYNVDEENFIEKLKSDKVLQNLSAIKNNHIYQIETKHLTTVSHHVVKGIEDISDIIIGYNKQLNADKKKTPD